MWTLCTKKPVHLLGFSLQIFYSHTEEELTQLEFKWPTVDAYMRIVMVVRCQHLLTASTDCSELYNYSGIDLLLPFWYVCTGALTCIQPASPLLHSYAQCEVCAKNTAGFKLSRTYPSPFIYFGCTAVCIFISATGMSRFLHTWHLC